MFYGYDSRFSLRNIFYAVIGDDAYRMSRNEHGYWVPIEDPKKHQTRGIKEISGDRITREEKIDLHENRPEKKIREVAMSIIFKGYSNNYHSAVYAIIDGRTFRRGRPGGKWQYKRAPGRTSWIPGCISTIDESEANLSKQDYVELLRIKLSLSKYGEPDEWPVDQSNETSSTFTPTPSGQPSAPS